ncbi:MAG: Sigma factor regulatory protein FecR/PupR family [Elusimicrobia bacterium]|nr:MAG: Sigma factor regulatory protein FecR/PupR family [Elusimicrobiota bacterium]KAF0153959.1 MAG: Sigma factor regulatory protein FecR/PupR family [Elusimicrobiota bacterium]
MRKYISAACFILAFPALSPAQEARVLSFAGSVEVKADRDVEWAPAEKNMEIKEGGAVRTGADGAAMVLMPNKAKVWMRENSGLEIEQRKTLASRLSLLFGRMKVRVPHLMRKERFEVRTPSAVCAVRGTEFTVDATPEGAMDIKVLYGEVKLNFTVPPVKGKSEIHLPQGQFLSLAEKGKPARQALLTKEQEYRALENWHPGLDPRERMAGIAEKENSRAQIKEFAKTTTGAEQQVKAFINTAKESDLEAGRTLNDVHGNLVRVEQRLIRPDPQTLQFVNIVKRPTYANYSYSSSMSNTYGFKYNYGGAITNRLDMFQVNLAFDRALPQRIEEWPSFFNDNTIKPSYMTTVAANRTDASNIFFVAEGWKYEAARDELINNIRVVKPAEALNSANDQDVIITGVLTGAAAIAGLNKISKLEITDAGSGALNYTGTGLAGSVGASVVWAQRETAGGNLVAGYDRDANDVGSDQLWRFSADPYLIGGSGGAKIWLARESYVIGNSGNIRNTADFTSSGSDPFAILKENAAQVLMYIKQNIGATTPNTVDRVNDYAFGVGNTRNIDLVFIPDLAVAAIQRMLPAITELGN